MNKDKLIPLIVVYRYTALHKINNISKHAGHKTSKNIRVDNCQDIVLESGGK